MDNMDHIAFKVRAGPATHFHEVPYFKLTRENTMTNEWSIPILWYFYIIIILLTLLPVYLFFKLGMWIGWQLYVNN